LVVTHRHGAGECDHGAECTFPVASLVAVGAKPEGRRGEGTSPRHARAATQLRDAAACARVRDLEDAAAEAYSAVGHASARR
jgi:hypothetical protein